jgi:hypothetical protein
VARSVDAIAATLPRVDGVEADAGRSVVRGGRDARDHRILATQASLQSNASLTSLSLSENLIGDAEALNSVQPDLETGGEALASMLRSNKHVTYLDVSWNKIRRDSAQDLAQALAENETLTSLNIAHNAFCDLPGQYLGISLASNNTLQRLDLSYNSLSPQAAIVIASAFATNTTLHYLSVAGNPLGRAGAEALITALRRHQTESRFLHIDFASADVDTDLGARGGGVQFSSVDPTGRYRLDMRTPYSQMIARRLYELASTRMGCSFQKCVWSFKPPEPEVLGACVEINFLSAMTRPCWLRRAVRNRHRHAIEQASRRWRGGRRDDSARRRREI